MNTARGTFRFGTEEVTVISSTQVSFNRSELTITWSGGDKQWVETHLKEVER